MSDAWSRVVAGATVIAALAASAGCTSTVVVTSPLERGGAGLAYSLPKAQVQVVAQRKQVDAEEVEAAKKAAADAKAGLDASQAKLKGLKAALAAADAQLKEATARAARADASDADRAARTELDKARVIAQILVDLQVADEKAKAKAHEAAQSAAVALVGNVGEWLESVTLTVLPHMPDPAQRYVLQHRDSGTRDDKFKIEVSNGLLSSGANESTGQVSAIVLSLARSLAGVRTAGAERSFRALSRRPTILLQVPPLVQPPVDVCQPFATTLVFDPTDAAETGAAIRSLEERGMQLVASPSGQGAAAKALDRPLDGLLYRPLVAVSVTVTPIAGHKSRNGCGNLRSDASARVAAALPDSRHVLALPVEGTAFVKTSVKYAFKEGIPVSAEIDRPSQWAAVASLPLEVVKAIVGVPAEIIKLRVDYSSQAKALVEGQTAELKALKDLLAAQKALDEARAAAGEPD